MEDTLGGCRRQWQRVHGITVLILVLMEDTLGDRRTKEESSGAKVLILVLMEDTLGERRQLVIDKYIKS